MEAVAIKDKYNLTVAEAVAYFNVGEKRIRRIIAENPNQFTVNCGARQLIVRHKFEKFIDESTEI